MGVNKLFIKFKFYLYILIIFIYGIKIFIRIGGEYGCSYILIRFNFIFIIYFSMICFKLD